LHRHRIDVLLHFGDADFERVDEGEILGMLGEYWREHAGDNDAMKARKWAFA